MNLNNIRQKSAYTFIELSVVILIILIIATMSVPRFIGFLSEANLGSTARRMAGVMAYIRYEASKNSRSYFLTLDLNKNEYYVSLRKEKSEIEESSFYYTGQDAEAAFYKEYQDEFIKRTKLSKRIEFRNVIDAENMIIDSGVVRVEFRADGSSDSITIYFKNLKDEIYTVHLKSFTAKAEIYDYYFVPEQEPTPSERE